VVFSKIKTAVILPLTVPLLALVSTLLLIVVMCDRDSEYLDDFSMRDIAVVQIASVLALFILAAFIHLIVTMSYWFFIPTFLAWLFTSRMLKTIFRRTQI